MALLNLDSTKNIVLDNLVKLDEREKELEKIQAKSENLIITTV